MVKIKKILVPLDGSKNSMRGLDEGIYLARQCQATITGLYVVPLSKPKTNSQILSGTRRQLTTFLKEIVCTARIPPRPTGGWKLGKSMTFILEASSRIRMGSERRFGRVLGRLGVSLRDVGCLLGVLP